MHLAYVGVTDNPALSVRAFGLSADEHDRLARYVAKGSATLKGNDLDVILIGAKDVDYEPLIGAILSASRRTRVLPLAGFQDLVESGVERWRNKKWMAAAVENSEPLLTCKLLVQALKTKIAWPTSAAIDRRFGEKRISGLARLRC